MIICVLIVENCFKKMQLEKENNLQTQVTAIYGAYIGTIEHNWEKFGAMLKIIIGPGLI